MAQERQGLGKNNQGRLEPVPIEILPAGKSLDACAAIKEEQRLMKVDKEKQRKRRKKRRNKLPDSKTSTEEQVGIRSHEFAGTISTPYVF